jgi:hypothetical protein
LNAPEDVFINCPFDEDYRACFEALLFAVCASGYKVRCALEDADTAIIHFEKLRRIQRDEDEAHPYKHYRAYLAFMNDLLRGEQALGT